MSDAPPEPSRGLRLVFDFAAMIETCTWIFRFFDARVRGGQNRPVSPQEMAHVIRLENVLAQVRQKAYRVCWDGKAWCKFRKAGSVCALPQDDLDADPTCIEHCTFRGGKP